MYFSFSCFFHPSMRVENNEVNQEVLVREHEQRIIRYDV